MKSDSFPSPNVSLVSDRRLWFGEGTSAIEARATLYHAGGDTYELYTSVGGEVPHRRIGPLGLMMNVGQIFVNARKAEGYSEDLQQYTPNPIN